MTISIGVQGASGGLGASSLVVALAVRAAQAGREAVCVDQRWAGGGLDVVLGVEQHPGLRWPDLARARGVVDGHQLQPALPGRRGVRVLSVDRRHPHEVPVAALQAVRRGLEGVVDLVVHDLPSPMSAQWPAAVRGLDRVVLLAGCTAPQVAAATAAQALLDEAGVSPTLVLRPASSTDVATIAAILGASRRDVLADDPSVAGDLDRGIPPGSSRGRLRDLADRLLADCLVHEGAA